VREGGADPSLAKRGKSVLDMEEEREDHQEANMKINQKLIEDKVINRRNEGGRRVKDGKVLYT
jgi:hypothetical protein